MSNLQEATQNLRKAESLVASIGGQLDALKAQEQKYAAKLAELGLTPEQVPAALARLQEEEERLEREVNELMTQLAGALA